MRLFPLHCLMGATQAVYCDSMMHGSPLFVSIRAGMTERHGSDTKNKLFVVGYDANVG